MKSRACGGSRAEPIGPVYACAARSCRDNRRRRDKERVGGAAAGRGVCGAGARREGEKATRGPGARERSMPIRTMAWGYPRPAASGGLLSASVYEAAHAAAARHARMRRIFGGDAATLPPALQPSPRASAGSFPRNDRGRSRAPEARAAPIINEFFLRFPFKRNKDYLE